MSLLFVCDVRLFFSGGETPPLRILLYIFVGETRFLRSKFAMERSGICFAFRFLRMVCVCARGLLPPLSRSPSLPEGGLCRIPQNTENEPQNLRLVDRVRCAFVFAAAPRHRPTIDFKISRRGDHRSPAFVRDMPSFSGAPRSSPTGWDFVCGDLFVFTAAPRHRPTKGS